MPFPHAQQPMGRDRFIGTLDLNQLRLSRGRCAFNQSRGGRAEHHPTRRSDRLHPLSHPHLLTDGGVTERPRTDLTGDHLTRVQAHPQLQLDTVAVLDLGGKPLRLLLNAQRRQAGANSVVLQRNRRAEHRHDAVAGELVHRAAVPLHHRRARLTNSAMISRSRSAPTAAAMSIECTTSANSTVTCLYSADRVAVRERCTALVTELGVGRQFGAARPTRQPRRGQSTATIPAGVHVSIVSPLVSDVRHIAVPSPTRSFETLICRLFETASPLRHAIRVWSPRTRLGAIAA